MTSHHSRTTSPVDAIAFLALVPLLLIGVVALLFAVPIWVDDWDHARLKTEMAAANIASPTSNETDWVTPHRQQILTSPDKAWMIDATWHLGNGGYDWELIRTETGKHYSHGGLRKDDGCFLPTTLSVLWSLDSHYVALTEIDGCGEQQFLVINLAEAAPHYLGSGSGVDSIRSEGTTTLGRPFSLAGYSVVNRPRSKALKWINNTDLETVLYLEAHHNVNALQIETAAHQTYHFDGNTYALTQNKCDFVEKFITDL